jgi:xanthine dehydrogenase accessory factor
MHETPTEQDWSVPAPVFRSQVKTGVDSDEAAVVATVADVSGNAYRRPGAKMLIDHMGAATGQLTAGCLADDIESLSEVVLDTGEPVIERYDLSSGDGDVWGLGVGCDGEVTVLLEPLSERYRPVAEAFADQRPIGAITVIADETGRFNAGTRMYYDPVEDSLQCTDNSTDGARSAGILTAVDGEKLLDSTRQLVETGRSAVITVGDGCRVFVDGIVPLPELVIFGSGPDVQPVVVAATNAGFRVTVVGFRGGVDIGSRFPTAERTVTSAPGNVAETLDLTRRTHAVVMTHNFVDDQLTVEQLLSSPVPYVGILGPSDRFERLREAIDVELMDSLSKVYAPVGLDLGGGSPNQVAHSIVAELLAVANDTTPTHLRNRDGTIHERVDI